ncbi:HNH endonuclease [Hyalangium gracile]|uniref:HNH endonuclease n=1 Tax=Hyalangium gracile TaxID=394092 RepID=UPI001CCCA9C8
MLRRLLANAHWYEHKYDQPDIPIHEEKFENEYLRYHLSFESRDARQLAALTYKALDASKANYTNHTFKTIKERSARQSLRCELCGGEIDYATADSKDPKRFSLDHIWPRSLGGTSDEDNLRVTCGGCNEFRQNYTSAADMHYEHWHVKVPEASESFLKEADRKFRLAVNLRSNFACQRCDRPVSALPDGLRLEARSREENHNIFNSISVCIDCKP